MSQTTLGTAITSSSSDGTWKCLDAGRYLINAEGTFGTLVLNLQARGLYDPTSGISLKSDGTVIGISGPERDRVIELFMAEEIRYHIATAGDGTTSVSIGLVKLDK